MANFFEDLMDMFSGNKKKEQGAEQAPSLQNPITEAWTGFLNKVNESAKQNIQSGHYTVAQPQQQQTSPAMDYSMQPQEMSWDDLTRATADKLTEMITGKKKAPWETDNPFGVEELNDRYKQTVIELADADPELKNSKNIFKDAYDLINRYMDDTLASYDLVKGFDVNPLNVADREWRKALDAKIGEYSAVGKGAEELRAMLDEGHYETEKQHREKQNQGIIAAAEALRNEQANPEERKAAEDRAARYDKLNEIIYTAFRDGSLYGMDAEDQAIYREMYNDPSGRKLLEEYEQALMAGGDASIAKAQELAAYGQQKASALRSGSGMTFDEADQFLSEQYPMYALAKETGGNMDAYSAAYGDLQGIARKIQESGVESLTDAEDRAWQDAISNGPEWLGGWLVDQQAGGMGGANLNQYQADDLAGFSAGRLRQMQDVAGLYTPYTVSPKNQAILDAYIQTPAGAEQYYQESIGTDHEQQAWDNRWFVNHRAEYEEIANRPDFQELVDAYQGSQVLSSEQIARGGKSEWSAGDSNKELKPEEDDLFKAVSVLKGEEGAREYLKYMQYETDKRYREKIAQEAYDLGNDGLLGGVGGTVAHWGTNMLGGLGFLDYAGQYAKYMLSGENERQPINTNTFATIPSTIASQTTKGVMDQVNWVVPVLGENIDLFDKIYGIGVNVVDNMNAAGLGKLAGELVTGLGVGQKAAGTAGKWTVSTMLGTSAAQNGMEEVEKAHGSNTQKLLVGIAYGLNEGLWESLSISRLMKESSVIGRDGIAEKVFDVLKSMGTNFSEEFNTTVANQVASLLIMKEKSELNVEKFENIRLGLSSDAAEDRKLSKFFMNALNDGIDGAIEGGIFGVVENVQSSHYTKQVDKAVGGGFSAESLDTLYSLAESEEASDKAKKLARKFPKGKANAKQTGELFRELSNTMGAGIREALHNMGVADIALQIGQETGTVDRAAAEAVTAMMQGENLSGEQVAALAANPAAMKIVDELFKPEAGDGVTSSAADAAPSPQGEGLEPVQFEPMPGMEEAEAKRRQAGQATQIQPLPQGQTAGQRAPKTPTKPPIRVKGKEGQYTIEELKQDGTEVRIRTSGGEEISLEDADVDAGEAAVIQAAAGMENQDEAAAMIAAWQNGPRLRHQDAGPAQNRGTSPETQAEAEAEPAGQGAVMSPDKETARADEARQAQDFAMGFRAVYEAAQAGKTAEGTQSIYADMLAPEARQAAEEAGRQAYEQAEAQAEERNAQEAQAAGYRTVKNAGADAVGVLFDRVRDGIKKGGERVNAMLQMLDRVGREFGMQYRVVDKLENDANGKYVHGTNIVYLSLDAEEGAITKAASHEGFHFISQFSPDMAKTITDFVMDKLRQVAGYDIDQRIREVMQQYRDQAGQELTPEAATEEIVADSMLDVIGTEENMQALMKESKSTAEKIKEWITNTYQKFKDILNRLARNSPEVAALKDDVDYLGRISSMWQEGMRQAAEAWRQAQVGYNDGSAALEQNQAVQQYRQEMQSDRTVEDRESSLTAFLSQLFMDTQKQWIQANMDAYDEGLAKYRQALLEYKRGGVALNVALERAGLSSLSGNDIRVASYAADQALTLEGAKERANARNNGEQFSLPNKAFEYMKSFKEQLQEFVDPEKKNERNKKDMLTVGSTPKVLHDIGLPTLPILINQKHVSYAIEGTYKDKNPVKISNHEYEIDEYSKLLDKIADPVAIIPDRDGKGDTIDVIIEMENKAKDSDIAYIPLKVNMNGRIKGTYYSAQHVTTVYNNEEVQNMINNAIKKDSEENVRIYYLNLDKAKAHQLVLEDGLNPAVGFPDGLIHTITESGSPVKIDFVNQTDSMQFRRWFDGSEITEADGKTPKVMYHGTASDFWAFDMKKSNDKTGRMMGLGAGANKIYLTEHEASARMAASGAAARTKNGQERVIPLYVSAQKVMDRAEYNRRLQEAYKAYPNSDPRGAYYDYKARDKAISAVDKQVKAEGYDGVWDRESGELFVYNPTQVKSATENKGFFDPDNPDIRYSLPSRQRQQADAAAAVRQDAELYAQIRQDADSRAALELLMRMHEQTTQGGEDALIKPGAFEKRLSEMVEKIKADTATKMGDRTIRKGLRTIYQAMEKPGYSVGEILTYAKEFYQQVLEQAPGVLVEMDEGTREAVRILRTNRFRLTDDQKSEIKGTYGSLGDFMRKNFGKLKISNSATVTLADVWRESLNPLNPGLFAEDTAEADMPGIIDAFLENAHEKKFAGEFGANIGAMSTDGALNLMLDFYDVPGAYKQKSEVRAEYQERFDNARALVNQYRQEARQAMNTARAEYQQKYRERLEKDRQTKAEREAKQGVINEIRKNVRPLKTMLVKGTDNRHIPEAMRGAMERMLNNLGMDRAIFSGQEARELYMKLGKWAADSQLHDAAEASAYDPDILAKLEWLEEHAGKSKALRDMTMQELEAVRDAVQNMYKMVTEENEIEVAGRKRKVSDLAENVMGQMKDKKDASSNPVLAFLRKVGFKEMTPVYYAKQVGGTLGDLINDIIRSESDVAFIIKDAKEAFDKAAEKYHLNEWIHDKKHLIIEQTTAGDRLELTREQAMTLYAWAEREKRNTTQSAAHLRRGGFTYDRNDKDVKQMKGVNFTKSHVLSDADVARIRNYLTEEQRGFVETMVKYLSENMAEKGNEASMRMFGWKKFGEKWYFPYPTDRNFRGKNSTDAKGQPDKQIKYMGSSHALTENAMNPLKLGNFTDIWAGHVDEMARYSVMAEKLDNLQRVTNYVVGGLETETGEVFAPESVKKEIERALGQEGAHYLEQFIRDANGGVMGDERGLSDKFISLFKKGSVAANMSVILQQPSAFVRAMSMVNPRYFGKGLHEHGGFKATRERMYANSGVANLKQWGGFDTNTGGSFANTLLDSVEKDGKLEKTKAFIDEWTGKGAEKADEITWVYMYSAIEAEIDDRTDYQRGTEDFNQAVAKRFDEVMRATQVYDSSMAKSEWMRSTSTMDKVVTSFMAEPTLWINMMMDAALDVKNNAPGARGKAARAVGVFVAGTFVNSLLQSIATAFRRKKDEGTTMAEKYLAELAGNFTDSLSIEGIAGMIPIARDIVSLAQGYDVERADMAVIGNMIDAWRKMEQHIKKGEMPDVDEWMNLAGMAGNLFGVPVRNIYRDVSGIFANTFGGASSPIGETSWRDIMYSVLDDTSWNSFVKLWDPSNAAYYDRMEQALLKGDMDKYNELRGYLEDTKRVKGDTISKGIRNELKESVLRGLVTEEKAVELMVDLLGVKDEKTAFDQIDKYVAQAKANGDEDFEYSKYAGLMDAVKSGGDVEAEIKRLEDRGNARKTVVSTIKSQVKDWYLAGDMTKAQAEKALKTYVGISDSDNNALYWTLDEWDWLKANPNGSYKSYGNIFDAVDSGNAQKIKAAVQKHLDHPHTKQMATDVHRQITDHFKPIYVELVKGGKKTEAANLKAAILTAYEAAGYARDMKNKDIDKWVK